MKRILTTKQILDSLTAHDQTQLHFAAGIRGALGIALPLIVGGMLGQVPMAVVMAVGALIAGLAGLAGTLRQRLRTMTLAALWIGLASLLGSLAGHSLWATMIVTMISGFAAGLMVAISPEATQIGTLATIGLVIFSGFPATPYFALTQTLFVMGGGLLQITLMILMGIVFPPTTEVASVFRALDALADYAEQPIRKNDLNLSYALAMAEGQVSDSFLASRYRQYLWDILRMIQRIRGLLVTELIEYKVREGIDVHHLVQMLRQSATDLQARSKALSGKYPVASVLIRDGVLFRRGKHDQSDSFPSNSSEKGLAAANDLAGTVSALMALVQLDDKQILSRPVTPINFAAEPIMPVMTTLEANMTGHSAAFRHALRMAIILAIAVLFYELLKLPRGYWVPLTTLVILKPDFFSTVIRGTGRVLGTMVGVVLATALLAVSIHSEIMVLILLIGFSVALYTVFSYNYTLFSAFMTAEIVILLSFFDHLSPAATIEERLFDTILGAFLALMSYLLWPRWQRTSVPTAIAELMESQRLYLQFLIARYGSSALTQEQTAFYQLQIQLARTNAISSLNHVISGRDRRPLDIDAASGLLTALHRFLEGLQVFQVYCVQKSLWRIGNNEKSDEELQAVELFILKSLSDIEHNLRTDGEHPAVATLLADYIEHQPMCDAHSLNGNAIVVAQALYGPIGTMIRMIPLSQQP